MGGGGDMRIECSRCQALSDHETTMEIEPRFQRKVGRVWKFALCFSCREELARWIEAGTTKERVNA